MDTFSSLPIVEAIPLSSLPPENRNEEDQNEENQAAVVVPEEKRRRKLTDSERQRIVDIMLENSEKKSFGEIKAERGIMKKVASEFNVSTHTVNNIWSKAKQQMQDGVAIDVKSRMRGKVGRKGIQMDFRKIDDIPPHKRTSIRALASALNMPTSTVHRAMKRAATSEKDIGNDYYKQKKYDEAIQSYSSSLTRSRTAVAYANRAAAYLKVGRYLEAESDCTEALKMDKQYLKAYARRATAKKELGKLKEAKEDLEVGLKLEPEHHEMLKLYFEINSLLEKGNCLAEEGNRDGIKTQL